MSSAVDTVFLSTRVVTGGAVRPAAVLVKGGAIVDVVAPSVMPRDCDVVDVLDAVLLPGLVDTHVHVNEPGRTDWEGFATATRAAALGGITTIVDMPLNSLPPTTSVAAFEEKLAAASGQLAVDVGFWGGLVPGNTRALAPLVERGVLGFKSFLVDSGVPEFRNVERRDLDAGLGVLREAGVPLLAHAELQGPIDAAAPAAAALDARSYRHHLIGRPKAAEDLAVALLIELCRAHRAHVHVVHHCSSSALAALEAARHDGLPLSAETCPHYLTFAAEEIADGATHFKCTPHIRERDNREALWGALTAGVLDSVVSDHSPCTAALKRIDVGDFDRAWGGVSGLQLSLSATWSQARTRGASLVDVARWMSERPAALAGLTRKGAIAKGKDADLVAFDPDASFVVDQARLAHKNPITPFHGRMLAGAVRATWLRGRLVTSRGSETTTRDGRTLLKGRTT